VFCFVFLVGREMGLWKSHNSQYLYGEPQKLDLAHSVLTMGVIPVGPLLEKQGSSSHQEPQKRSCSVGFSKLFLSHCHVPSPALGSRSSALGCTLSSKGS